MNKMKVIYVLIVVMVLTSITLSVQAFSNSELISFVTQKHTVLGRDYQLSGDQITAVNNYLQSNPVSDTTADSIRAQLTEAMTILNASGVVQLSQLPDATVAKVTSLIQSAASQAGLKVSINGNTKVLTVTDASGAHILSASYAIGYTPANGGPGGGAPVGSQSNTGKLVYTGASNTLVAISGLAIIAVATVLVIRRKV